MGSAEGGSRCISLGTRSKGEAETSRSSWMRETPRLSLRHAAVWLHQLRYDNALQNFSLLGSGAAGTEMEESLEGRFWGRRCCRMLDNRQRNAVILNLNGGGLDLSCHKAESPGSKPKAATPMLNTRFGRQTTQASRSAGSA